MKKSIDGALFEYWHAVDLIPLLQQRGVACILDMHNILWQSYRRQFLDRKAAARALGPVGLQTVPATGGGGLVPV